MPIEIKELIIRASVRDAKEQITKPRITNRSEDNSSQEERIISRCVEQVMDILRIQKER